MAEWAGSGAVRPINRYGRQDWSAEGRRAANRSQTVILAYAGCVWLSNRGGIRWTIVPHPPSESITADISQDQMMSIANERIADAASRSTLFALMEAPNVHRHWRVGRRLQFHRPSWTGLDSTAVTELLQRPVQRPHVNLQEIARLLGECRSNDESQADSNGHE